MTKRIKVINIQRQLIKNWVPSDGSFLGQTSWLLTLDFLRNFIRLRFVTLAKAVARWSNLGELFQTGYELTKSRQTLICFSIKSLIYLEWKYSTVSTFKIWPILVRLWIVEQKISLATRMLPFNEIWRLSLKKNYKHFPVNVPKLEIRC